MSRALKFLIQKIGVDRRQRGSDSISVGDFNFDGIKDLMKFYFKLHKKRMNSKFHPFCVYELHESIEQPAFVFAQSGRLANHFSDSGCSS